MLPRPSIEEVGSFLRPGTGLAVHDGDCGTASVLGRMKDEPCVRRLITPAEVLTKGLEATIRLDCCARQVRGNEKVGYSCHYPCENKFTRLSAVTESR